jgi:hypothetical protein
MTDVSFTICETCREPLDASDPEAVRAVELVPLGTCGDEADNNDVGEGLGVLFHASCFPEGHPGYRRK